MENKSGDLEGPVDSSAEILKTEKINEQKEGTTTAEPAVPNPAESFPDPDEDDLDDLDDMLDEFTPSLELHVSPSGKPPIPTTGPLLGEGLSDEDFAKQLQAGMADLLGELDANLNMQAQFETMLKELGAAGALEEDAGLSFDASSSSIKSPASPKAKQKPKAAPATSGASAAIHSEESFQETIKKTMERMQTSGDQATAAAASEAPDDMLAEMMKAMQASGMDGGEGTEEDFSKMILGMMEQLTNKEILYEPMKELDDKFPAWMEKNAKKTQKDDLKRYQEQQIYVREIVGRFEKKGYSDDNAADREYIVDRMQKMQAAGTPPPDLVGDMAAAQQAFGAPDPEEGCAQQ